MKTPPTIMIVEDEALITMMLQMELEDAGYTVAGTASTGAAAIALQKATHPDLILMDIHLADGISGMEAARQIRAACNVPIIFVTGYETMDHAAEVGRLQPSAILPKPVNIDDLRSQIASLLKDNA